MYLRVFKHMVMLLTMANLSKSERRIVDGIELPAINYKRYIVYIVKTPESKRIYDSWLCGGAIIKPRYIISSSACVIDTQLMYVIAGTSKYNSNLTENECAMKYKKRVVKSCLPVSFDINSDESVETWSQIDVAVLQVETPYNFTDKNYEGVCDFIPGPIEMSFDKKHTTAGTDVLVFGWGHRRKWRLPDDKNIYNQDHLQYTSTTILGQKKCLQEYQMHGKNLTDIISRYMICTAGRGHLSADGASIEDINDKHIVMEGCDTNPEALRLQGINCNNTDDGRRKIHTNQAHNNNTRILNAARRSGSSNFSGYGICQNDHGGPLVTWSGSREVLIGIASVFRVSPNNKCTGPYLFTSLRCTSHFILCSIEDSIERRSALCNRPPSETGFAIVERNISWPTHPDEPADIEK